MQNSLRPLSFKEFIGQNKIIETLKIVISSAKQRTKQVDHILFYGPPGLGKTSLATIVANEMAAKIRYAQGPLLEKKADILSLFGSLANGDVIFIDEIHGINKNVEELIYSALEEGFIDLVVGTEGDSKIVRMKLPAFTLIGATTKIGKISSPLKDRFGLIFKLKPYDEIELAKIISNSAKALKIKIDNESIAMLASYSRNTPRIANNLLKRVNDFIVVKAKNEITLIDVQVMSEKIGLYKFGLLEQHIQYMDSLVRDFASSWVSIDLISGFLAEEKEMIEQEIEPILINLNFIEKSSRGRKITLHGKKYLNDIGKLNLTLSKKHSAT